MNVLFMLDDLCHGGTERVTLTLLRHLLPRLRAAGHDAALFVAGSNRDLAHLLPPGLQVFPVLSAPQGRMRERMGAVRRVLQSVLRRFDVAVPATPHMLLAVQGMPVRVLPWVHFQWGGYWQNAPLAQKAQILALYPWRRDIVAVTDTALNGMPALPWVRRHTIPNPFDHTLYPKSPQPPLELLDELGQQGKHRVAFLGRLSPEKGVDRLLEIRKKLPETYAIVVAGDGPQRQYVQHVPGVHWLGAVDNPLPLLQNVEALAVTSRTESFGMTMVEAVWAGTPVVAYDCPTGPRELLTGKLGRYVVPDGDANHFVSALQDAISAGRTVDPSERDRLLARVSPDAVARAWMPRLLTS
jgi:glycosyltransferase involved in cell wall biosynthesis